MFHTHRRRFLNRRDLKHKHDTWRSVFHTHRRRFLNRRDLKHKHHTWRSVFHLDISVSHVPSLIPQLSLSETQAQHLDISVSLGYHVISVSLGYQCFTWISVFHTHHRQFLNCHYLKHKHHTWISVFQLDISVSHVGLEFIVLLH